MNKKNPADLLSKIYDPEYPLNANTLSIIVGGAGSGKSYFCYNVLARIYLDHFDVYHFLICSKTAKCDATLNEALEGFEKDYPYMQTELIPLRELTKRCETIRANAIKSEQLIKISKLKTYKDLRNYLDNDLERLMTSMASFEIIQSELYLFIDDMRALLDYDNYHIKDINQSLEYIKKHHFNKDAITADPYFNGDFEEEPSHQDPEDYDINYTTHNQGLGLNKQVLFAEETKPHLVIDWEGKEINEEEYEKLCQREIFKWIRKNVIKPRVKSEFYGPPTQPILAIVDDNVGDRELTNPRSSLTQLLYLRRHLHLSVFILAQTLTGINTNIRRNTNVFHLLPSLSVADLETITFRVPANFSIKDLREQYNENNENKDRNQCMTSLFCVYPHNKIINGAPPCVLKYYQHIQKK